MSQNRNRKSSCSDKIWGSFLSRHRPDALGALQQSLILQSDMDKIMEMNYNGKCELKSLRPFTQLNEQTQLVLQKKLESTILFLVILYLILQALVRKLFHK